MSGHKTATQNDPSKGVLVGDCFDCGGPADQAEQAARAVDFGDAEVDALWDEAVAGHIEGFAASVLIRTVMPGMAAAANAARAERDALGAALDETTRMLAYLWGAENHNGQIVRDMFYDDDPLLADVPRVIAMADAALGADR